MEVVFKWSAIDVVGGLKVNIKNEPCVVAYVNRADCMGPQYFLVNMLDGSSTEPIDR